MSKTRRNPKLTPSRPDTREPTRGKVTHDERGNAVWDWALDNTVLTKTTRTGLIRKLAPAEELTLQEDPKPSASSTTPPAGGGGDPYNRRGK